MIEPLTSSVSVFVEPAGLRMKVLETVCADEVEMNADRVVETARRLCQGRDHVWTMYAGEFGGWWVLGAEPNRWHRPRHPLWPPPVW